MITTPTKKINMVTYFEILTIKLYVIYILIMHIKSHANQILFIIQLIFLCIILDNKNMKFKYLINDIAINL